jgi:peptide/nickel transport system ATP-binding protein/oligopeptide transport system ATP-binding protein
MSQGQTPPSTVLEVQDLNTVFHTRDGCVHAVNNVDFALQTGELLGVVGESGSGKSVTMMSLLRLLPCPPAEIVSGRILFQGRDVLQMTDEELRALRGGEIGFIFQDPMTSLNPVFTVGYQLIEALREHLDINKKAARIRAADLLSKVGIAQPLQRLKDYPHQFSGGMRQRVMIAMALACQPRVLIADEPTTALDVTIQAQILELVKDLRRDQGMGIIWITHDLGVVAGIADRVMVMYGGKIVEHALVKDLFRHPRHPYTRALLAAIPGVEAEPDSRLHTIGGQPPGLTEKPTSCSFAPRCERAFNRCRVECPPLVEVSSSHQVACWLEYPHSPQMPDDLKIQESIQ